LGWNISVSHIISQNLILVTTCIVVFFALLVGFIQLLRKDKTKTLFLTGAVFIPILILIIVQETGFSMLNEKHCAGVVGVWYILLAAIIIQISRYIWGKCAVLLYVFLIFLSLSHFYFQPEIYSRRSNFSALNSFLTKTIKENDVLISYHLSPDRIPDYLPILEEANHYIDLYLDNPSDLSFPEYISSISSNCTGKIFLIYDSRLRPMTDPDNYVLSVLTNQYQFIVRDYGRNTKLYEFLPVQKNKLSNISAAYN